MAVVRLPPLQLFLIVKHGMPVVVAMNLLIRLFCTTFATLKSPSDYKDSKGHNWSSLMNGMTCLITLFSTCHLHLDITKQHGSKFFILQGCRMAEHLAPDSCILPTTGLKCSLGEDV